MREVLLPGMMSDMRRLRSLSSAHFLALLALIFAVAAPASAALVTATGIAPNAVQSKHIKNGSITSADLAANSVTTKQIKAGSVNGTKLTAGSVGTAQIADGSITAADLAPGTIPAPPAIVPPPNQLTTGAVTSAIIADGTITAADIAPGTVTATQIAAGTIAATQLGTASVAADELADDAVTSSKVLNGTILAADIAADAVTATQIATGAVTGAKILDATITSADIAPGAVSTASIADGSVATNKLADGSVTGAKLSAVVGAAVNTGAAQSIPHDTLDFGSELAYTTDEGDGQLVSFVGGASAFATAGMVDLVGAPTRVTITQSGLYQVTANVVWSQNSTSYREVEIVAGATAVAGSGTIVAMNRAQALTSNPARTYQNVTGLVALTAGDWITLRVSQASGSALDLVRAKLDLVRTGSAPS